MTSKAHKGRGATSSPDNRFATFVTELDAEEAHQRDQEQPKTQLHAMRADRIVSSNASPDIPFDRSINPYLGCEHGCVYCYARPSHSYLDMSPGIDFETQIYYKPNAAERLLALWQSAKYECKPITIGANTDPYQPAEKSLEITRQLLTLFEQYQHPVNIITKSHLIARDSDLLQSLAEKKLCSVAISVPTLDASLKRIMEPRVPAAGARLRAIRQLADLGIPVSVLVAPVIPAINDHELESILETVAAAGATRARYIFLRLPHELGELFADWLQSHFPERADHVMSLVRQASGGKNYDARFAHRQTGQGAYAEMLGARFRKTARKFGLNPDTYQQTLDCNRFLHPARQQMELAL